MELSKEELKEAATAAAKAILILIWDVRYIAAIITAFAYFGSM